MWEGILWLEGFLGFEPRVAESQLLIARLCKGILVKPLYLRGIHVCLTFILASETICGSWLNAQQMVLLRLLLPLTFRNWTQFSYITSFILPNVVHLPHEVTGSTYLQHSGNSQHGRTQHAIWQLIQKCQRRHECLQSGALDLYAQ